MPQTMSETQTQSVRTPQWLVLDRDERMLLRTGPSNNLLMAGVVGGFFFITLVSFPFIALEAVDAGRRATFASAGLSMVLAVLIYLWIRNREYAVTSKRVSAASGLREKEVASIDVAAVEEVELVQEWWHDVLRVGTLAFVTETGEELTFDLVGSPHFVYERALDFTEGSTTVSGARSDRGSPT